MNVHNTFDECHAKIDLLLYVKVVNHGIVVTAQLFRTEYQWFRTAYHIYVTGYGPLLWDSTFLRDTAHWM